MEPNYEYIKRELSSVFSSEIKKRNLRKLIQYITIKFSVDHRKFCFKSNIEVLVTVKSLQPTINKMMEDFASFIPTEAGYKSGGAFTGIMKIDVKMSRSKRDMRCHI